MQLSEIDYELPEHLIAQKPIEPRDAARLLVSLESGAVEHRQVADLADYVSAGDVVVVNNTRVLPARLRLQRRTGGEAEVLLLESQDERGSSWEAMIRPARKLKTGEVLEWFGRPTVRIGERTAAGDTFVIEVLDDQPRDLIDRIGSMPLPPYIKGDLADRERYQTVYSQRSASAAAPTAGLHFTPELLDRVRGAGAQIAEVELVVGLDTFKPISTDDPLDHVIHTEWYRVPEETWEMCRRAKRVIAIGTTATRALESAATRHELEGRTDLFIYPGYEWKAVDIMLTNFHLPKTSLLLMIGSFVGPEWRNLYASAIAESYRFLSFGDAMLIGRRQ